MDFVDDLGLIDRDIKMFRNNKSKYWMEKLNKDNSRMFVNTQLKGKSDSSQDYDTVNPVVYDPMNVDPMNTQMHGRPDRMLLMINPKKGRSLSYIFIFIQLTIRIQTR